MPMGLQSLEITDFRNIQQATLGFSSGLNLITGSNAAGKTSLLEAIYCLGRVRSFRTSRAEQPIRYGQPAFRLVGRIGIGEGRTQPIGIERQISGLRVHLNGAAIARLSDLAGSFPVQVLSADTATIINGGPRYRRQTLDWALFHVEQGYREVWQRYTRVLRQRNAALRSHAAPALVRVWDDELVEAANHIDRYRQGYIAALGPHLTEVLHWLLPGPTLEWRYLPGWPASSGLSEILETVLEKDRAHGFTQYGPHRADFRLLLDGHAVAAHCSRGQQKAVTAGFMLAQVKLQQQQGALMGAFLLDDLTSELDAVHQQRVLDVLRELDTQVFVSAIDAEGIYQPALRDARRFHVERGIIQEVV